MKQIAFLRALFEVIYAKNSCISGIVIHIPEIVPAEKIPVNRLLEHPVYLMAPLFQDDPLIENLGKRALPDVGKIQAKSIRLFPNVFPFKAIKYLNQFPRKGILLLPGSEK